MNNIGIIAEYNPFHNGHLYHLEETKRLGQADNVIAVMSGDFTQRGEPAIYNKWVRAEMAVNNGVDLVIELPFVFACNNAEYFASGSMGILNSLGCISHFSFGSESGAISPLRQAAALLVNESTGFKDALKEFLNQGMSYPRARYEALKKTEGKDVADVVRQPNNILAVEYLKQWLLNGYQMKPITVKRSGRGYHDKEVGETFSSATAIRKAIRQKNGMAAVRPSVPEETYRIMNMTEHIPVTDSEGLFHLMMYKILTSANEQLSEILSAGEGLENSLKKSIIKSRSAKDIVEQTLSKRYTETRINRLLIHTLASLTKEDFFRLIADPPLYARVLGFSDKGAGLIRHIKKTGCSSIPIISNINKEIMPGDPSTDLLKYDILSADIYNLAHFNNIYKYSDHVSKPFHG